MYALLLSGSTPVAQRARPSNRLGVLAGDSRKLKGQTCFEPSMSVHSPPSSEMDTHVRNRVTVGRLAGPAGEGDALRFLGAMIEEQRRPEEGKNKRILCCPGCAP